MGCGWDGSVALGQQRRGGGSKSARSILMSLTCGAGLEYDDTRRDRATSAEMHPKRIFGPSLCLRHLFTMRWTARTEC
jgi:hypothetical protein